jgi:hypothetical protein
MRALAIERARKAAQDSMARPRSLLSRGAAPRHDPDSRAQPRLSRFCALATEVTPDRFLVPNVRSLAVRCTLG